MRRSTKNKLGAVALFVGLIFFFRWDGYYDTAPTIPWTDSLIMAAIITVVVLRVRVILERHF